MKAIVLAGGGGTRLWPLSRENYPKQFIRFGDDLSLLQKTIQRLLNTDFIDTILVATNTKYLPLVQEQLASLPSEGKIKILEEPCRKNTAPAIALAIQYLQTFCSASDSDSVLVLPSDHLIEPEAIFHQSLQAMDTIAVNQRMVTFGIRPSRAETGYGYIRIGKPYNAIAFEAAQFIEKPDLDRAKKYLEDPNFYWNSGMFLFSIALFWKELRAHSPEIFAKIHIDYQKTRNAFPLMPETSIDYALMEKSRQILICPLAVSWSDIGSWDSLYEVMDKDQHQNVKIGQVLDIDTKNSLIIGSKRLISTIGLEDMIIIETEDAIFIAKKGESQRVKTLVKELLDRGRRES